MNKRDPLSADEKGYIESLFSEKLQSHKPSGALRRKILKNMRSQQEPVSILESLLHSRLQLTVAILLLATTAGTTGYYAYRSPTVRSPIELNFPVPEDVKENQPQPESPPVEYPQVKEVKEPDVVEVQEPEVPTIIETKEAETPTTSTEEQPVTDAPDTMQQPAKDVEETRSLQQDVQQESAISISLSFVSISDFRAGEKGSVILNIENNGSTNISSIEVQANFDGDLESKTLTNIGGGEARTLTFSHTFTDPGEYKVIVLADRLNANIRIEKLIQVK